MQKRTTPAGSGQRASRREDPGPKSPPATDDPAAVLAPQTEKLLAKMLGDVSAETGKPARVKFHPSSQWLHEKLLPPEKYVAAVLRRRGSGLSAKEVRDALLLAISRTFVARDGRVVLKNPGGAVADAIRSVRGVVKHEGKRVLPAGAEGPQAPEETPEEAPMVAALVGGSQAERVPGEAVAAAEEMARCRKLFAGLPSEVRAALSRVRLKLSYAKAAEVFKTTVEKIRQAEKREDLTAIVAKLRAQAGEH